MGSLIYQRVGLEGPKAVGSVPQKPEITGPRLPTAVHDLCQKLTVGMPYSNTAIENSTKPQPNLNQLSQSRKSKQDRLLIGESRNLDVL